MSPSADPVPDTMTRVATVLGALLEQEAHPSPEAVAVLRRLAALIDDRVDPRAPTVRLSPRQAEIARQIADGRSNRSIAAALFLSERTVEKHVSNILEKTGGSSRTSIAVLAVRHGLAASRRTARTTTTV